jgi:phosphate acetyltransferase
LNPTIKEIVDELDAKVLFGGEFLNNEIGNFSVDHAAAITIIHPKDKDNPGDRADIILGAKPPNPVLLSDRSLSS